MAGVRWLETDTLSNQDISSALVVGAYTANADRYITAQLLVDQVAGNGDYVAYVTLQVNGAGSAYRMGPKTTLAAASGETAIGFQSGVIFVRSGDIVTVYIDGLAGDTTTPDTIVRWAELDALRPTTADRTLDVTATGEGGIDWANIGSPTATVDLANTTISASGGSVTYAGMFTQDSGETFADAVAGSVVAEIANHATMVATTLTASEIGDAISGDIITIIRGDTFDEDITVPDNTGYVSIDFTVKASYDDTDDQAILRIRKNASETDDGLLRINGAEAADATKGSITVNSTTSLGITLAASVADDLILNDTRIYDIQYIYAAGVVSSVARGTCKVSGDVTRSVS